MNQVVYRVNEQRQFESYFAYSEDGDILYLRLYGAVSRSRWHPSPEEAVLAYMRRITDRQQELRREIRRLHDKLRQINSDIEAGPPALPDEAEKKRLLEVASQSPVRYNDFSGLESFLMAQPLPNIGALWQTPSPATNR
jgi:hypothetical protein